MFVLPHTIAMTPLSLVQILKFLKPYQADIAHPQSRSSSAQICSLA